MKYHWETSLETGQHSKRSLRLALRQRAYLALALLGSVFTSPHAAHSQTTSADWLLTTAGPNGSLATASDVATSNQSTSEAVRALKLVGAQAPSIVAAEAFVLSQQYRGTEELTRAITAHVERGTSAQLLATELLTRQNQDGGYGELAGYQSTPLDTAFALTALVRAGQFTTSPNLASLNYLISTQGASGGWSIGSNEASVFVTAYALEAVWQFRHKYPAAVTSSARAKSFLLAQRQSNALWRSDFESALALIALAPTQSTQGELSASVAALTSLRLSNGSWNNDVYATALALRAITLASAPNANPDLTHVRGAVVDGDSLVAMSGVTVRLTGPSGSTRATDTQGAFVFPDLAAGSYLLAIEASGYPPLSATLNLRAGQTLDLGTLRLLRTATPTHARIEGHVTDAQGADLAGVTIEVTGVSPVQTDAQGRYLVSQVTPGSATITASKPGYFIARGTTTLLAGATVNFSPALREVQTAGFNITGTFTDSSNSQPLAGVRVAIVGSAQANVISDAAGVVSLSNLAAGEISIEISLSGYATRSVLVTANGGQTLDISTELTAIAPEAPPAFALRGRVTDAVTGGAIGGAAVSVAGAGSATTTSDGAGNYVLEGLTPGAFTVTVSATGYQSAHAAASAQPFQSIDFSPALTAIGSQPTAIHAVVIDGISGAPIEGAEVVATAASTSASATSAPNGQFLIRDVQPIETLLTITANGYVSRALTFTPREGFVNDLGSLPLLPEEHAEPITLTGRIVDSTNNAVLAGVTVTATTLAGTQAAQSDGDGRFSVSLLAGQVADLTFTLADYSEATFTVFVAPESADIGQVRLRPSGLDALFADLLVAAVDGSLVTGTADTYQVSGSVAVHLQNQGYAAVPAGTDLVAFEDRNRDGVVDEDEPELGRAVLDTDLVSGDRRTVTIQVAGTTSFRDAPVTVLADAERTVIERSEDNNSGTSTGSCVAIPPAASALSPVLKWRWAGSPQRPTDNTVFGPVMVGQMSDDNGDGAIDSHDVPDLVFSTQGQSLTVVSGDDGRTLWQSAANTVTGLGSPALGDIDGDGLNEIVISNGPRTRLLAFEHNGTLKWNVPNGPTHSDTTRDGIAIADLNADGVPEIITGRRVYSNTGALLWQGANDHGGTISYGTLPIAADINRDGTLEVIAGRTAYRSNGTVLWHQSTAIADGFNAIGNFDEDEFPEIVLVTNARAYLLEHTGAIKWGPVTLSGANSRGGAPTVGDFDGDGQVEIGIAGASFYTVLETDGSLKWRKAIQDASSAFTGSSLFDFDGDGRIEVVYADEQNLFIWDGATGNELFRTPNRSGTTLEYPVVADVDGDGRAELVVAANEGNLPGVRVFEGGQGEWMPTRSIWNQSAYHVDNVSDDGSIPAVETASWLTHNTFRANAAVQRQAEPVADLTAGRLVLIDRGIGQPAALRVRLGNAGASLDAGLAIVAFYDGSPTAGGRLLGNVSVPALAPGAFVDLELDGITNVSAGGTLFAVADSARRITECDEENNTSSTPGRPALGTLTLTTAAPTYPNGAIVEIATSVTNTGLFANAYRVEWVIRDVAGSEVARLVEINVPSLASGATYPLASSFDSAGLLAGRYTVHAELKTTDGQPLATASVAFALAHDPSSGLAASLRLSTDRPTYHTTDAVQIDSLSRNLTTATLINAARLHLTVQNPQGANILDQTFVLGDMVAGAMRDLRHDLTLSGAAEGAYGVAGALLDASDQPLATATASFTVTNDPRVAITGAVTVGATSVEIGQTLLCSRATTNGSTVDAHALGLRYSIVRLDSEALIRQDETSVDIASGATRTDVSTINTGGYAPGDYACTLQANLSGQWRDLAYATFKVTAPAVRIDATLTSEGRGRLLVLMDQIGGWPCTSLRQIELWAPFRTRLPTDARIDVELLDAQGRRVDFESLALAQYRGTVNQRRGSGADLSIVGISADVLTVNVENNAGLGEGYRIVATATADSLPPIVVESNVMGSTCGWNAGIGARFGDFHCSGGTSRNGGVLPQQLSGIPTLAQQRAFLEQLLDASGWSHTIVTDDEAFERELRTGAYSQYALFSEHEKLDEQVQKELREAVYRGEGLLDAGQHDHRHHAFDEALGIIPVGRQPHVAAVAITAPWTTNGTGTLSLAGETLRTRLDGAQAIATYVNVQGHDTAAAAHSYGNGKSVYVGYDLLAEATRAGAGSIHAALLLNALDHVAPDLVTSRSGAVIPLRLTVQNREISTAGRALLSLPSNVTVVDGGGAQYSDGVLSWPLSLSAGQQQSFTVLVRLPDQAGAITFDALVQSGVDPDYSDKASPTLTMNVEERASLSGARDLAQTSIRFLQVRFWLEKSQFWLDRDRPEFALASLVHASTEVMKTSHPQSHALRLLIDDVIWQVSQAVE